MRAVFASLLPLLASIAPAAAKKNYIEGLHKPFGIRVNTHPNPNDIFNATFEQPLDHSNPSLGTFYQRFWYDAQYWQEGGPVFVFNVGESPADKFTGYLQNSTIPGYYAQEFSGAVIVIEHRYFGQSTPAKEFTSETLEYLNLPNNIADMTNFAQNVELPFCKGKCSPKQVPWVLIGGSYSGALAAWTSVRAPGVFAAYHASSAVVQAIGDFYTYFEPVAQALPANCSADVRAVVAYVDYVLANGTAKEVTFLKSRFNLEALNNADFADQLAAPVAAWQEDQDSVIAFCDYIESGGTGKMVSHAGGVGLVSALDSYAAYIRNSTDCGEDGSECDTWGADTNFNDPTPNWQRAWNWMICNEPFGWWQVGPPTSDGTNIVSSHFSEDEYSRRCPLWFPAVDGHEPGWVTGFTPDHTNQYTGGWNANFKNVVFVNGELDPWRSATLSSDFRPGGKVNTTATPVYIVPKGVHCPELFVDPDDQYTWPIVQGTLGQMNTFLTNFKPSA